MHIKAETWWLTIPAFGLAYWLVTLRYRRRAAAAEDVYYKAAKVGKYVENSR